MSKFNVKEIFCNNMITLRKQKNLKQSDVAEALGISDKTYSKWETGESDPGISSVMELAEYFGISPAYFFNSDHRDDIEQSIDSLLDDLTPEETIQKAFEIQFYAVRCLAKRAIHNAQYQNDLSILPPENRVNKKNAQAITAFASEGVYEMMYNGIDANIAVSLLPNEEKYEWLITEREQLSEYLSLIGNVDFLKLLPFMLDSKFPHRYTAEYLAGQASVAPAVTEKILGRCVELRICNQHDVHIGDKIERLFITMADQMLVAILTLTHLSLPNAEKNGCYYFNTPAKQIISKGMVN